MKKVKIIWKYATPPPREEYPLGIFSSREEVERCYAPVVQRSISTRTRTAVQKDIQMTTKNAKSASKSASKNTAAKTINNKIKTHKAAGKIMKAMAKVDKKANERISPIAAEEKLVILKSDKGVDDLPTQAQAIVKTLKAKGGKLAMNALLKSLDKALDTVQSSKRIYTFYQRRLLDGGFIGIKAS